jgi:hypothetical protein
VREKERENFQKIKNAFEQERENSQKEKNVFRKKVLEVSKSK